MMIGKRVGGIALGVVAVVALGQIPLVAQEPAPTKSVEPAPKKKVEPGHRVPPYFGQVGLSNEQRAKVYVIRAKRHEKIQALEKQIATEKAEELAECETVLNETQRKLLENLRRGATESTAKPGNPPKSGN